MKLKSNPADKVERRNIDRLIPYARNSRVHSPDQIAQLAASIKEWGWTNPILVDVDGQIIAGHGRLEAARMLKLTEVPVMVADGWTEAQKRAYVIADNKLALNSDWDTKLLSYEFDDLKEMGFDLDLTGFTLDEISALSPVEVKEGLTDEDSVPEVPEEPKTRLGDIYQLGNHRLMCGDSTSVDAVQTLLQSQRADMVFTDPPYNVAFNGRSGKFDVIKNDDLPEDEFSQFIQDWLQTFEAFRPNSYYICCNWAFYGILQTVLKPKACIVWAKNVFGLGRGYRHQHEFIMFDGLIDPDIKNESDLWNIAKDSKYVHPTQKPVAISERAIKNSTKINNIVLDYFGGSGSTLIACEKQNRHARLMELDPKYCDVIVKRWEDFTGKKASLVENGKTFEEISNARA
jgi:DNA modification methylase